ncbi:MAG: hypothetical protein V1672_02615 [Candidatus Diapherotrites archaeon]
MGIYNPLPNLEFSKRNLLMFVGIIMLIIVAYYGVPMIMEILQPSPFYTQFDKPALDMTDVQARTVILSVYVTNVTGETATNSKITVFPVDSTTLIVHPSERVITTLGVDEKRKLDFTVRTNPNERIYPGEYNITVKSEINETEFEKEVVLTVKTAD